MWSLPRRAAPTHPRLLVRRLDAERYMRLMLIGFAGSVLGTRAFLALTGYPQIGGHVLHFAHALWGGLLLLAAAVVPLIVANRVALVWTAVLTGIGAGLFVDEIGKFITVDNDYFFPAAAPITYAIFLLCVWVYLRARRRHEEPDPRAQLYAALELLTEALEKDLNPSERAELEARLASAARHADTPDLARLAGTLLHLARPGALTLIPDDPGLLYRTAGRLKALVDKLLTGGRLRAGLVLALAGLGLLALSDLTIITTIAADLADHSTSYVVDLANRFARIDVHDRRGVVLLLVRAGLDVLVGATLLTAAFLLLRSRSRRALDLAQGGLLTSLTVVNLLVFYLEQFLGALFALAQVAVLYAVQRYQQHLAPRPPQSPTEEPAEEPADERTDERAGATTLRY